MRRIFPPLALSLSLMWSSSHAAANDLQALSVGLALMHLNEAPLQGVPEKKGDIWTRIRRNFQINEVNPELIRQHENRFAGQTNYFKHTIDRAQPYLYHIVSEVEKRHMPSEIALLPFIESAFVTRARSKVGASGLWQFMPATGLHYGLEQTNLYDGRHDIYAATSAALDYLQYLYGLFNDWSLALAAYNWGEGSVLKAIERAKAQGLEITYENLRMPSETRNYVPKLLAVRNIVNDPQTFGITLPFIANNRYFDTVSVDAPLDIRAAARLAGIDENEFIALNPGFNTPVFVPNSQRKMLLPVAAVSVFEHNYQMADKAALLSWDIYTLMNTTTLADIAAQTGMSIKEIKRLNNINSNKIAAGRSILLTKNSFNGKKFSLKGLIAGSGDSLGLHDVNEISVMTPNASRGRDLVRFPAAPEKAGSKGLALTQNKTRTQTVSHKVRKGETLAAIAKKYHVTTKVLSEVNSLRHNRIKAGQVLKVVQRVSPAKVLSAGSVKKTAAKSSSKSTTKATARNHIIKKGDTLYSLAKRYNTTVATLQKLNPSRKLVPGAMLRLP